MKGRRLMRTMATAVMTMSMLGGCGGSGMQSTTGASTTAAKAEGGNVAGTMATDTATAAGSALAVEKNYNSTFDVAGVGDVSLNVMIIFPGDSDGGPYLRGVMDDYTVVYPDVKPTPVECSMSDLYIALITQVTVGTLPDISIMTKMYFANCLGMGMSVNNMNQLLSEEYLNDLIPAAIENATVDDTLIYMLWQDNITAVIYRKDLSEEKGTEMPKTQEQFFEAAKALTEDLDGDGETDWYGCVSAGTRDDFTEPRFQTFALTYGCDFVTDNGDGTFTSGFGTSESKNAITSFVSMAANQEVTPPGPIEADYSEAYATIVTDQVCMFFGASNVLGGIYSVNPEMWGKIGGFPTPTTEGVDPATSFSSMGMTTSNTCRNPEVVVDFLKYMTSAEDSITQSEATYYLSAVNDALTAICEKDEAYAGFAKASDSAVICPMFAGLAESGDICGKRWQTAISGNVFINDAVTAVTVKVEEAATPYNDQEVRV